MTNIGKKCIIRCYASGVHYGTLAAHEGRQVTLTDSRRLWRWHTGGKDNGVSLSAVALTGIDASRSTVEPVLPEITLLDAIEIIPMSDIDDGEMTRMCLAVNQEFGSGMAGRLMDLIVAARKEVAKPANSPETEE